MVKPSRTCPSICRPGAAVGTFLLALAAMMAARPVAAADFMFRAVVNGQTLEGKPLNWTANEMLLLGRDGRLHEFDPRDAKQGKKTGGRFVGYPMPEMKRALYEEFGDTLEITTTKHYLVVHPRGQSAAWGNRFEELYRSCLAYFRVRGFRGREPDYPLVAIVYRNQADYFRAASASGTPVRTGTLGHYDAVSNRVFLYDAGKTNGDWSENAATIIHEATHQTAYNVGIHNRFAATPRWLVEGLATMFEARGVWNSQSYQRIKDRLVAGRLHEFRERVAKGRPAGTIASLVSSNRLFRSDPTAAYAESWALSLYLCETRPRQYVSYLATTDRRPMFSRYSDVERMADFQAAFGNDLKQLEANFLAWMAKAK